MVRGKPSTELISKEKVRKSTPFKRKSGLSLELIRNEKVLKSTFLRKKSSLKKKLYELTTLCGVDACMIICCPCEDNSVSLDVWPQNHTEVRRILEKYKSKCTVDSKGKNPKLSDYFEKPKWEYLLDHASVDQLKDILGLICGKIERVKEKQRSGMMNKGGAQCFPTSFLQQEYYNKNLNICTPQQYDQASLPMPIDPTCGLLQNVIYNNQPTDSSMECYSHPINSSVEFYYSQPSTQHQFRQPTPRVNEFNEEDAYFSEAEILEVLSAF